MATGDRFYIADKPTLDLVKLAADQMNGKLDSLQTGTTAVGQQVTDVKSLAAAVDAKVTKIGTDITNLQDHSAAPAILSSFTKMKYVNNAVIPLGGGYSTLVNVTSPGTLYLATILCIYASATNATNQTNMQILVDGTIIYDSGMITSTSYAYNVGYASAPAIVGAAPNSGMLLVNGGVLNTDRGTTLYLGSTGYQPCMTSLKPIKWNSSLLIRAYNTQNTGNFSCLYELD